MRTVDIEKDKCIKEPKKKAAPKASANKGKKRAKKEVDDNNDKEDSDASESEEKPKKAKKAAAKGGRKGEGQSLILKMWHANRPMSKGCLVSRRLMNYAP